MPHDVLARDLGFPEGPVWLGPLRVAFTQIRGQCVSIWEDGRTRTIAKTGGGANGATLGPDGALYVANNGGLSLGHEGQWRASNEIAGRIQSGEVVTITEYAAAHPEYADRLQRLLPSMQALVAFGQTQSCAGALPLATGIDHPAAQTGVLGDFRIVREIGHGGMGVVYEAEQISLRGVRVAAPGQGISPKAGARPPAPDGTIPA